MVVDLSHTPALEEAGSVVSHHHRKRGRHDRSGRHQGRRIYNSPSYQRILGYTPSELAKTLVFEQIHPDDRFKVLEAGREARATGVGKSLQYRLRHKNERGEVEKLVVNNRDVTQRVEAEEKLAHNTLHDALTDLPNRRLFLDRLDRCLAQAQRDSNFHYAVLLMDLDGFKALNDSLGSAGGDQLLIETGNPSFASSLTNSSALRRCCAGNIRRKA